jgi:broad specificity phosphatase PhoE
MTRWNVEQRYCGHSDIPLSGAGRAQARWLAHQLQRANVSTIFSSDLSRAQETAEIITAQSGSNTAVTLSSEWREIDFGAWEGLTYTEVAERFEGQLGFFTDPEHYGPVGGETLVQVLRRVETALIEHVYADVTEGDIVIVSHGGPLRILLCRVLGMALNQQWQLRLDPGSLSALDLLPQQQTDSSVHGGILALLNVQHSKRIHRSLVAKQSPVR